MSTPSLDKVQRWLHEVITHPDGITAGSDARTALDLIDAGSEKLESVVTKSSQLSAAERLAIYGNAYYARLLECLGEVFPVTKKTLGEETFDGFGFGYLQDYPSRSYTLHHLGRNFIDYLRESRPVDEADGSPDWTDFLIDLAKMEWAIYDVFDGPGIERLPSLDFSQGLPETPSGLAELHLVTAPCLRLLEFDFPVNQHYTEMRNADEDTEWEFPPSEKHYLAITRRDYIVRRYPLNRPKWRLLKSIQEEKSLGDALADCVEACTSEEENELFEKLPDWFRYWGQEEGFFTEIKNQS